MDDSTSADSEERDRRSFFASFVAEDSSGVRRSPDRTVRDAERAAGEPAFFVPLPTRSQTFGATLDANLVATVAEEPGVFRKRKQRAEIPLGAVVACIVGCVLMVGLIVYQKTKGPTGAAIAVKAAVAGQLKSAGEAGSPIADGPRDGGTESTPAKAARTQPAGKGRPGAVPAPKDNDEADDTPSPP